MYKVSGFWLIFTSRIYMPTVSAEGLSFPGQVWAFELLSSRHRDQHMARYAIYQHIDRPPYGLTEW